MERSKAENRTTEQRQKDSRKVARQPDRNRQTAEGQRHRALYLSTMWQPLTREAAGCAVCAVIMEGVVGDGSSMI